MAGQEQRHDLVAHLAVCHPAAIVGVLRLQEDREDVGTVLWASSPIRDHAVHDRVEVTGGPTQAHVCWCGEPQGNKLREEASEALAEVLLDHVRRVGDCAGLVGDVGIEERLGGNGSCDIHHLLVNVDRRAVMPAGCPTCGIRGHGLRRRPRPAHGERGLHEPSLPQPEVAFGSEQPVPQERSHQANARLLMKSRFLTTSASSMASG